MRINGARVHYEREGAGPPVVFLHAGVADSRMWDPQVAEFAKHFDVIRPDQRGFGESDLPPVPWSPVADLVSLIDQLELEPAHVVGCSMGGALAIDFALNHPERILSLVLVGSDTEIDRRALETTVAHASAAMSAAGVGQTARALISRLRWRAARRPRLASRAAYPA